MIFGIIIAVALILVGTISGFFLNSVSGLVLGVCSVLNGIVLIMCVMTNKPRPRRVLTSVEICDTFLEIAQDLGIKLSYHDLGYLLMIVQSLYISEFDVAICYDDIHIFDGIPTTIDIEHLYGDDDIITNKPMHTDTWWVNNFLLINAFMDYKNIRHDEKVMGIISDSINKIPADKAISDDDFKGFYEEVKPYLGSIANIQ